MSKKQKPKEIKKGVFNETKNRNVVKDCARVIKSTGLMWHEGGNSKMSLQIETDE
jgi:hypothetical protein